MDLTSQAIRSGSALATKQRIAVGSSSSAASKPKLLQQAPPKLLTGLFFKKKPPQAKESSSMSDVQVPNSSTAGFPGVEADPSSATKQTVDEPPPFGDVDAVMFDVSDIPAPPPIPA